MTKEIEDSEIQENLLPDCWWKAKLWMIPYIFPYCLETGLFCFDHMELECPDCEGFPRECKGCMARICESRCFCILRDPDTGEIITPGEDEYLVPLAERRVYNAVYGEVGK